MNRLFPIFQWLPYYRRDMLVGDALSGISAAILLMPQGMAYAILAGLPPVYGLYAALVPQLVYVIMGTSRQLSIGPVAMDSLIVAAGIGTLKIIGVEQYIATAIFLALFVGLIQVFLGVLKLGFLVNFLSKPVLNGFISGVAILISISQLKHLFRVEIANSTQIHVLIQELVTHISEVHLLSLGLGLFGIILIKIMQKIQKRIAILFVVILGTFVLYLLQWHLQGVQIVGDIPKGLPQFKIPLFDSVQFLDLVPIAFVLALVGFTEAISVAKLIEENHPEYSIDANQELIALGSSNVIGSFAQSYPVTASFSRSVIQEQGGAKTGVASLFSAGLVLFTLLFFTSLFFYLPIPILAAIIIVSIFGLIDFKYPITLWKKNKEECIPLIGTFIVTTVFGISQGIIIGIILSLIIMIYRTSKPHFAVLGQIKGTSYYKNITRFKEQTEEHESILILRFDAQLFFGNQEFFKKELFNQIKLKGAPLKLVIINAKSINYIDSSAINMLEKACKEMKEKGLQIMISGAIGPIRDIIFSHSLVNIIGSENLFVNTSEAVDVYLKKTKTTDIQKMISCQNNKKQKANEN